MARPVILVSAHTEKQGTELPDAGISLSDRYSESVLAAGGLPLVLPCTSHRDAIEQAVKQADGVLLSGGEDVAPELYRAETPADLLDTVVPADGGRDAFERALIESTLSHRRPVLAICRGQQILNVVLGGDLIVDIPLQCPGNVGHNRMAQRLEPVHDVEILRGSLLARVTGVERMGVNSTHHQAVGRVAPGLRVVARSADGIIEALEADGGVESPVRGLPYLLSVQFHPERLSDRLEPHRRIFDSFVAAAAGRTI